MRRRGDEWVLSTHDALAVVECDHRFALDHAAASGLVRPRTIEASASGELVMQRGRDHQADVVAALRSRLGLDLVEVRAPGKEWEAIEQAAEQTRRALDEGVSAVHGGVLLADGFVAFPDVLTRVHPKTGVALVAADLRPRYEPMEIKLAHSMKDDALVQLGVSAEALTRLGHPEPEHVHAWLGTGEIASEEAGPALEQVRAALTEAAARLRSPVEVPDPIWADKRRACRKCRWAPTCAAGRAADRDLSMVWGIRYHHVPQFREAGLPTIDRLAEASDHERPEGMEAAAFVALRSQAAVQLAGERSGRLEFTVHSSSGLDQLPPPDTGDLYYDIEGDPFHDADGSLEYLHGFVDEGEEYTGFWAHSRQEERLAFERTLDLISARRQRFPDAHVYHYAQYEPYRLAELAARHGTREDEVAELLASGTLVDLLTVVRDSVQVSVGSRSLKQLEPLYMGAEARTGDVQNAGDSIVGYTRYAELVDAGHQGASAELLEAIRAYNQYDCVSTHRLHRWLLGLRWPDRRPTASVASTGRPLEVRRAGDQW